MFSADAPCTAADVVSPELYVLVEGLWRSHGCPASGTFSKANMIQWCKRHITPARVKEVGMTAANAEAWGELVSRLGVAAAAAPVSAVPTPYGVPSYAVPTACNILPQPPAANSIAVRASQAAQAVGSVFTSIVTAVSPNRGQVEPPLAPEGRREHRPRRFSEELEQVEHQRDALVLKRKLLENQEEEVELRAREARLSLRRCEVVALEARAAAAVPPMQNGSECCAGLPCASAIPTSLSAGLSGPIGSVAAKPDAAVHANVACNPAVTAIGTVQSSHYDLDSLIRSMTQLDFQKFWHVDGDGSRNNGGNCNVGFSLRFFAMPSLAWAVPAPEALMVLAAMLSSDGSPIGPCEHSPLQPSPSCLH